MRTFIFTFLLLFFCITLYCQTCIVNNLVFSSQDQIDSFATDSNCTVIVGDIRISEANGERITNLAGLSNIKSIRGNLDIYANHGLKNLDDLASLDSIYGLFDLRGNDSLVSIEGVNEIPFVGQRIYIENNDMLTDLGQFTNIDTINNIHLHIPNVKEFNAFPNLRKVYLLRIGENILKDLTAFSTLEEVNDLHIFKGDSLVSLNGLENIKVLNYLHVRDNPLLPDLSGLEELDTIFYGLHISTNASLHSLARLENIYSNSMKYIRIENNPNLSICHYDFICESLSKPDVEYIFENNAPGCKTYYEVAKNCQLECPGYMHFKSQGEVDSFAIIFPNCTFIPGSISIRYAPVSNLDSLYHLTGIGSYLDITVANIKSLNGLRNLNTIGSELEISYCDSLYNLNGLEGITNLRYLKLKNNPNLTDMSGLADLIAVGSLDFNNQPFISGFNNLRSVGGLYVSGNDVDLLEFNFPPLLDTILWEFAIFDLDSLKKFPDAPNLKFIGDFDIVRTNLTSLGGLFALESIEGDLEITDNPLLQTLDGLHTLTEVDGRIQIERNESLINIEALTNINPDSLDTYWEFPLISIIDNSSLSQCEVYPVCITLQERLDRVLLEGNSPGCSNTDEVLSACIVNTSNVDNVEVNIYPNPTRGELNIEFEQNSKPPHSIVIYDHTGSIVETRKFNSTLDISNLVEGLYNVVFVADAHSLFSFRVVLMR